MAWATEARDDQGNGLSHGRAVESASPADWVIQAKVAENRQGGGHARHKSVLLLPPSTPVFCGGASERLWRRLCRRGLTGLRTFWALVLLLKPTWLVLSVWTLLSSPPVKIVVAKAGLVYPQLGLRPGCFVPGPHQRVVCWKTWVIVLKTCAAGLQEKGGQGRVRMKLGKWTKSCRCGSDYCIMW